MPPIDFYLVVVDILAKRYGWSWTEIAENMYWEDVYEQYEIASNLEAIDMNESMKFQFMLHAGSKDAMKNWEDITLPFPDRAWIPPTRKRLKQEDISPVLSRHKNKTKMTPEQAARRDEVKRRLAESKKKAAAVRRDYYYGK